MQRPRFILASASPRRRDLLATIGVVADDIAAADIDETPLPGELPKDYVARVTREKAKAVAPRYRDDVILTADTAVACGRRILPKAEDEKTARECLALLSGRAHRVFTSVAVTSPGDIQRVRTVETRVKVRRLQPVDVDEYIESGEWNGKAGGYAVQGLFAVHIISIIGSYSNIVGLPLYETENLLRAAGVRR